MRSRENPRDDGREVVTYSIRSIRCCDSLRWAIYIDGKLYIQTPFVDDTDAGWYNDNGICHQQVSTGGPCEFVDGCGGAA